MRTTLTTLVTLAALAASAATPSAAGAATVAVADTVARQMTVLDGTLVWIRGDTLMQRAVVGPIAAVEGAPRSRYRSIDLGTKASGLPVLTYVRCASAGSCKAYSDDLEGHRASFRRLVPAGCGLTSAPARWGRRVAYGLRCWKLTGAPHVLDATRSGVFVRTGSGAPRRLHLPSGLRRDGTFRATVDLRGTNVGALVSDGVSWYTIAQTVGGRHVRSENVAGASEPCPGPCDGAAEDPDPVRDVRGFALGTGGALWTLVDSELDGHHETRIARERGGCLEGEFLASPSGADHPAQAMAVQGDTVYLYVPGTGIVTHEFTPTFHCH